MRRQRRARLADASVTRWGAAASRGGPCHALPAASARAFTPRFLRCFRVYEQLPGVWLGKQCGDFESAFMSALFALFALFEKSRRTNRSAHPEAGRRPGRGRAAAPGRLAPRPLMPALSLTLRMAVVAPRPRRRLDAVKLVTLAAGRLVPAEVRRHLRGPGGSRHVHLARRGRCPAAPMARLVAGDSAVPRYLRWTPARSACHGRPSGASAA